MGEGPGAAGPSPKAPLGGPFLLQPAHVEVLFSPQQLIGDHEQPPGERHQGRLLAPLSGDTVEPGAQRLRGLGFVSGDEVGDLALW